FSLLFLRLAWCFCKEAIYYLIKQKKSMYQMIKVGMIGMISLLYSYEHYYIKLSGGSIMIKAVIFDFDGLILDTETAWYESYRKTLLRNYKFDLPLREFVKCVGADDTYLFNYLR